MGKSGDAPMKESWSTQFLPIYSDLETWPVITKHCKSVHLVVTGMHAGYRNPSLAVMHSEAVNPRDEQVYTDCSGSIEIISPRTS